MIVTRDPENLNDLFEPSTAKDVVVCFVILVALVVHTWIYRLVVLKWLHADISFDVSHMLVLVCKCKLVSSFLVNVMIDRFICAI